MIEGSQNSIIFNNQVEGALLPDCLYTILGPTASGKTTLAIALARAISGEIISVDSRQVYRGMDIGTGKDLIEYGETPYHLIDIVDAGEHYDISRFQHDFNNAYLDISSRGKTPIAVGGTGLYLQSLFIRQPYIHVKVDPTLRERLSPLNKIELVALLDKFTIPNDLRIDSSSHKRLIRGIEILEALEKGFLPDTTIMPNYTPVIFGIDPPLDQRRKNISNRLNQRIKTD